MNQSIRRCLFTVLGMLLCLASNLSYADNASPTYKRHRGTIVYQQAEFSSFSNEQEFADLVKKAKQTKTLEKDKDGNWPFFFLAFMSEAPKANKVNLVWYKVGKGKAEQMDYTEFVVQPEELTLQAQATLSTASGFAVGNSYEARLTRLINGKEKIFARCKVTIK